MPWSSGVLPSIRGSVKYGDSKEAETTRHRHITYGARRRLREAARRLHPGPSRSTYAGHAERRAGLPGAGRPDGRLPGRRDSRARRGIPRDGELPGGLVRAKGDLLYRSTGSRSKPPSLQPKPTRQTAEARLAKADNDVARYTPLVAKQAVSQQELDDAIAEQDAAQSRSRRRKAAVETSDARSRLHARRPRRSTAWSARRR